jgi:cardiolipin synthase
MALNVTHGAPVGNGVASIVQRPRRDIDPSPSRMMGAPWWLVALAGIGALALGAVVVTLFTAFGRRPGRIEATAAPPVDHPDFRNALAGLANAPVLTGGRARLLNNGVEIFPALREAIARARRTIDFMVYIWEPGRASDRLFAALTERARAGVEVRLLLDGVGGLRVPRADLDAFRQAGGRVAWFRPVRLGKLARAHRRNHRRAIVIDGSVGFLGGAAVGDKWLGDAEDEEHWRDVMVRVEGRVAVSLQSAFAQAWAGSCGEILVGEAFYPTVPPTGGEGEPGRWHVHFVSMPTDEAFVLRHVYWLSFRCAYQRLWITSPYFVPDARTRAVFADRARRGVDVRLLLPDHHTDAKPIRQASHKYFDELLASGVKIYEYQGTMLHAKLVVVDGRWSLVGSANTDVRSKELNAENVMGILDEDFARQLEATFLEDLRRARPIERAAWRRRPRTKGWVENFWGLFAEQY